MKALLCQNNAAKPKHDAVYSQNQLASLDSVLTRNWSPPGESSAEMAERREAQSKSETHNAPESSLGRVLDRTVSSVFEI
ncbi:hypothetical protein RRG08_047404 [Elysia crispata]|uniref:Uncharacterized protein n=1 Tax=Elysia crispata TaxID=231223 RepID=A0AAE1D5I3_9GAST|nr:hypothetical protein RRG08_047404 [Elysia crispata]